MSLFTKLRRRLANFAGYLPKGSSGEGKHGLGRLLQPLQARLMLTAPSFTLGSQLKTVSSNARDLPALLRLLTSQT
jgi:hypothetical protein